MSQLARSSDNFLILCNYLMGLLTIGILPRKWLFLFVCMVRLEMGYSNISVVRSVLG